MIKAPPKPLYRHPKPMRLPERKRMTIAAGVFASKCLVIAADTKESYGETHTYVDKITTGGDLECKFAIASSGDGYILDFLTPHISRCLEGSVSLDDVERKLGKLMPDLYSGAALNAYPKEQVSALYTQFLVAVNIRKPHDRGFLVINSTLVTRTYGRGIVIGCGPLREVGKELGEATLATTPGAQVAALSIVHEAKRRYSDVGGIVRILSILSNGEESWENSHAVGSKEILLDELRTVTNKITIQTMDNSLPQHMYNAIAKGWLSKLRKIRKACAEIEEELPGPSLLQQ